MYFQSHFYTSIHSLTLSQSKISFHSMFILAPLLLHSFAYSLHRSSVYSVHCTVHIVCMYKSICLFGSSHFLLSFSVSLFAFSFSSSPACCCCSLSSCLLLSVLFNFRQARCAIKQIKSRIQYQCPDTESHLESSQQHQQQQ